MPCPCRSAKGLDCLSHLIYTVCPCLVHTSHAHAMLRPCCSSQGHITARPSRDGLWATTRSSTKVVIRSIPISDAGGQCETKQRLSLTRKRVVATHYKKYDLLNCWTSSLDIPGYHADFHKGHGTIGAWHGHGMLCANVPYVLHVSFTSFEPCIVIYICN